MHEHDWIHDGVSLTEPRRCGGNNAVPIEDIKWQICTDLIASLTIRFDMADEIISATSLANKTTWPSNKQELQDNIGKIMMLMIVTLLSNHDASQTCKPIHYDIF